MTQDALSADARMLARRVAPIVTGEVAAAYARQVAPATAPLLKCVAHDLDYSDTSARRTLADVRALGIRAFMPSNVASAVDRATFDGVGGCPDHTPFNENLFLASAILAAGGRIAYIAEAVVEHGHSCTLAGLVRRYFDNVVSLTSAPEPLRSAPTGGSGFRSALAQARGVVRAGRPNLLLSWLLETGAKWVGFRLGNAHRWLPPSFHCRLCLGPGFHQNVRDRRSEGADDWQDVAP